MNKKGMESNPLGVVVVAVLLVIVAIVLVSFFMGGVKGPKEFIRQASDYVSGFWEDLGIGIGDKENKEGEIPKVESDDDYVNLDNEDKEKYVNYVEEKINKAISNGQCNVAEKGYNDLKNKNDKVKNKQDLPFTKSYQIDDNKLASLLLKIAKCYETSSDNKEEDRERVLKLLAESGEYKNTGEAKEAIKILEDIEEHEGVNKRIEDPEFKKLSEEYLSFVSKLTGAKDYTEDFNKLGGFINHYSLLYNKEGDENKKKDIARIVGSGFYWYGFKRKSNKGCHYELDPYSATVYGGTKDDGDKEKREFLKKVIGFEPLLLDEGGGLDDGKVIFGIHHNFFECYYNLKYEYGIEHLGKISFSLKNMYDLDKEDTIKIVQTKLSSLRPPNCHTFENADACNYENSWLNLGIFKSSIKYRCWWLDTPVLEWHILNRDRCLSCTEPIKEDDLNYQEICLGKQNV